MASEDFAVEDDGVVKRFGSLHALAGVSLRIRQGEVYGLLGPNGAGKTTLIRSLVGLVKPEEGSVTVLNRRMPNLDVLAHVGYMTQQAALYPDLTVEENLRFFAAINGVHGGIREALDEPTVGVDPLLRMQLWDRFQKMAREGTTILVSSHVMDEAERCDRLGLIRFGRLLAEGTVAQLQARAGVNRLEDAFLKLSEASAA